MSFNYYARKVRNPDLTLEIRRSALGSCILRVAWLTNATFQQIRAPLSSQFGLDHPQLPAEAQLLQALAALEIRRNQYLFRLKKFERKRIREKMRGQRHARKSEVAALQEAQRLAQRAYD